MLAQGGARVVLAEQAAALQLRHYELDKVLKAAGVMGRADDKAIAGGRGPKLLEPIRDLFWSADDWVLEGATAGDLHEVAYGGRVPHGGDHAVAPALSTLNARNLFLRKRIVEPLPGEVKAENFGEQREPVDLGWQSVINGALVLRFRFRCSGYWIEKVGDHHVVGVCGRSPQRQPSFRRNAVLLRRCRNSW